MLVKLEVGSDRQEEELRSLLGWLRDEPDVRRNAKITLAGRQDGPGQMGQTLEIVQLAVGTGFQLANLALAVGAWLRTRPAAPTVTIRHAETEVMITDASPRAIARIIDALDAPDR